MSEDILHNIRITNSNMDLQFSNEIFNASLIRIEGKCLQINNKHVHQLGLMPTNKRSIYESHFLREQTIYDVEKLKIYVKEHKQLLNFDQKHVFETVINKYNTNTGGFYFLDAPGGTGEKKKSRLDKIL